MPLILLATFTSALKGKLLNHFFRIPFVTTVGGMCYSIYLTHLLVIHICYAVIAKCHFASTYNGWYVSGLLFALPMTLLTGTAYYVLVERPCMDREWPQKLMANFKSLVSGSLIRSKMVDKNAGATAS